MSHLQEKHFVNRLDYLQAEADLIQKGLYGGLPCEDLIMKGGSGSGRHKSLDFAISNAKELSKKTQKQHHVIIDTRSGGLVVSDKTQGANIHGVATNGEYKEHNHSDSVKKEIADQISSGKIVKSEDGDIQKGGEGSKGGKVIGHTKTGKPIYEGKTADSKHYKDFTHQEHQEAADLHKKNKDKSSEDNSFYSKTHERFAGHGKRVEAAKGKESKDGGEDTFEHHRKMAGYHASKEQEIADTQEDFRSSSDKQLHESADEMEAERKKHQDKEHEHKEKAKKLHDPKKHGDWNSTLPKEKEALEYGAKHDVKKTKGGVDPGTDKNHPEHNPIDKAEGDNFDGTFDKAMTAEAGEGVTQKESVEHNPKDMQNNKPMDLKKAYEVLGLGDLIEKAEGSRGGKVVGHTKTGKPIYEEYHPSHRSFTADEHKEAANLHLEAHGKIYNSQRNRHVGGFYSGSNNTPEEQDKMKNHRESMEWHESMARHVVAYDKKKQATKEKSGSKGKNPHEKGTLEYHEHEADNTDNEPSHRDEHRNKVYELRAAKQKESK